MHQAGGWLTRRTLRLRCLRSRRRRCAALCPARGYDSWSNRVRGRRPPLRILLRTRHLVHFRWGCGRTGASAAGADHRPRTGSLELDSHCDAADATVRALDCTPGPYNIVDDNPSEQRVWLTAFARYCGALKPTHASLFAQKPRARVVVAAPVQTPPWNPSSRATNDPSAAAGHRSHPCRSAMSPPVRTDQPDDANLGCCAPVAKLPGRTPLLLIPGRPPPTGGRTQGALAGHHRTDLSPHQSQLPCRSPTASPAAPASTVVLSPPDDSLLDTAWIAARRHKLRAPDDAA